MKLAALATSLVAAAIALAAPAPVNADPDQDFATQLHIYGIYGPRDYNAWIGKITCKRLRNGLDADAYQSAQFVSNQLQKDSTTQAVSGRRHQHLLS